MFKKSNRAKNIRRKIITSDDEEERQQQQQQDSENGIKIKKKNLYLLVESNDDNFVYS